MSIVRFTHVDPFEDTERFIALLWSPRVTGFTHVDPFEDTERSDKIKPVRKAIIMFHPRRSVRGY